MVQPLNSSTKMKPWKAHKHCVICGEQNPVGLRIQFYESGPNEVKASWVARAHLQGYTGLLQGGVTASLLDSAMVNCLRLQGSDALTAEMSIKYLHPIPIGAQLSIHGEREKSRKSLHWVKAWIQDSERIYAKADGIFMDQKFERA